ncbi:MAG: nuclear transport factor 2 family protein, partial [Pyrinomonadaceae bacterium]
MKRITTFALALATAAIFAACGAPAGNTPANANAPNSNSNSNAAKPTAAAPTKDAVVALEKAAWEAWKNNDSKYFEANMSDKYMGFGANGQVNKAGAIKSYADAKCDVNSYSFSDEQIHMAGPDTAMLTFKAAQDATCNGKKSPAGVWSASVYIRDGDKWKNAFYAEAPVVDPKAAPAKPEAYTSAKKEETKPMETKPDAGTEALFAVEKKAWEDWKDKNAKGLEEFAAKDMVSLSGTE